MRRAYLRADGPSQRARARRHEVVVFLGSGAFFAALAGSLSDNAAAWPICGAFAGLLVLYVAAVIEADRRRFARRVHARRQARVLAAERVPEPEYAEAV